jgi:hypothetical protein
MGFQLWIPELEEEGEVIICLISNMIMNCAGSFYNILHRYSEETVVSDKENDSINTDFLLWSI